MSGTLTTDDLRWCKMHDWGRDAELEGGGIRRLTTVEAVDGGYETVLHEFGDRAGLMEFAGY